MFSGKLILPVVDLTNLTPQRYFKYIIGLICEIYYSKNAIKLDSDGKNQEEIISTVSSVLDMLCVYIAIVCEFHEALCLCVLRVYELMGYLSSVCEVENSEVEMARIGKEMDVLKRLLKKSKLKM
ncbi:hypothetical protein ADUPG1_012364 [Aduncisulcus paluster]|uniref:Uncharacterized protein n=1 Tax=Aduncisulcus paluster TaxID=2918883 RepID=A0ABQ5JZ85_9EUKA|nr:hypothetical protein ADUPG1_012364 [Aduncisulcus paluster]